MVHIGQTVSLYGLFGLAILGSVNGHPHPTPEEITDCHLEDSQIHCVAGSEEYIVKFTPSSPNDIPTSFSGCHEHGASLFCQGPDGSDVSVVVAHDHDHEDDHEGHAHGDEEAGTEAEESTEGLNCHFHAGVEHCTGGDAETRQNTCSRVQRDYNIPLRIGLIFAMLATSTLGVYLPIFAVSFMRPEHIVFTVLRQFGTGVIISTAFVHLFTHANLMFQNECLGDRIQYESTAAVLLMAGLFLSFMIEYAGVRLVQWHRAKSASKSIEDSSDGASLQKVNTLSAEMINIYVLEAGIIFHSFLIGLTLVVSGDAFFITLFIVVVFHQFFEGLALGTRIAALGLTPRAAFPLPGTGHSHGHHHDHVQVTHKESSPVIDQSPSERTLSNECEVTPTVSFTKKVILAALFAFVTPAGMALGTGILGSFNGNNPATLIAIGTLDAFSAGILVWVGVVEMWAQDWMLGGELTNARPLKTILGLGGLIMGMTLMSLLGKWA
ncbi:putative metal ion transmembrane transporter protein [Rhypophila sp. PSN 637]